MSNHNQFKGIIAAMGERVGHQWKLADALKAEVSQHMSHSEFDRLETAITQAGYRPLSKSALRQYRDAAVFWSGDTPGANARVDGLSFTVHRVAIPAGRDAEQILRRLVKRHGADNVTVALVKQAVAVHLGKVEAPKPTGPGTIAQPATGRNPAAQPAPTVDATTWEWIAATLVQGPSGDLGKVIGGWLVTDVAKLVKAAEGLAQVAGVAAAKAEAKAAPRKVAKVNTQAKPAGQKPAAKPAPKPATKVAAGEVAASDL